MNIALPGMKTYIVAATLILVVGVEQGLGIDVPGVELGENWMMAVMNALGLGTVRAAIGKLGA
ncbi:hypothetical protein [Salipiger mucosus]|uniref:Uncharacterized protein n=1 Tax=Salipiger mucosus DSM 16094 TaxID=1123237 RepID=S9QR77_9RHOB|nr:hypothetical protein [Salipiger mucosus]EPX82113.1 hypothetical protein Salmuc_02481 [Salipiger mucosus DSM 16094]